MSLVLLATTAHCSVIVKPGTVAPASRAEPYPWLDLSLTNLPGWWAREECGGLTYRPPVPPNEDLGWDRRDLPMSSMKYISINHFIVVSEALL